MPQLLVRNVESAMIEKLRGLAAAHGVSIEVAHRRVLRTALGVTHVTSKMNFLDYLRSVPTEGAIEFSRFGRRPRKVSL